MEIVLNAELTPVDEENDYHPRKEKDTVIEYCKAEKNQSHIIDTLNGDIYHQNYLNYLLACWQYHYNAIVDPTYLWHMVLSELSIVVKNDPETYRKYFTDSDDKKTILIQNEDPTVINTIELTNILKDLILTDIDAFLPSFSTDNENTRFAHSAVFCDTVSPFYSYMMFKCDIPRITVKGTKEDWKKFTNSLHRLKEIFTTEEQTKWFNKIIDITSKIYGNKDIEFWEKMIFVENCGSGGQISVNGWITEFFLTMNEYGDRMPHNFNTHIAEVEYTNISTKQKFKLFSGLFQSKIKDNYLIPEYAYVVNEIEYNKEEIKEQLEKVTNVTTAQNT